MDAYPGHYGSPLYFISISIMALAKLLESLASCFRLSGATSYIAREGVLEHSKHSLPLDMRYCVEVWEALYVISLASAATSFVHECYVFSVHIHKQLLLLLLCT